MSTLLQHTHWGAVKRANNITKWMEMCTNARVVVYDLCEENNVKDNELAILLCKIGTINGNDAGHAWTQATKMCTFFSWLISFCFYIISRIVHINYLVNEYFMLDVQKNDLKYRGKATMAYSNVLCCEETTRLQEIHSLETKLQFGWYWAAVTQQKQHSSCQSTWKMAKNNVKREHKLFRVSAQFNCSLFHLSIWLPLTCVLFMFSTYFDIVVGLCSARTSQTPIQAIFHFNIVWCNFMKSEFICCAKMNCIYFSSVSLFHIFPLFIFFP